MFQSQATDLFTGKEESVAVTIEPHYEVEVRVSHTISRRVCMTGVWCIGGFFMAFGVLGMVLYALISRGHQ
jgi:hypothetical protein